MAYIVRRDPASLAIKQWVGSHLAGRNNTAANGNLQINGSGGSGELEPLD
jgi:hypothetical protein